MPDSMLTRSAEGLYANAYLGSAYPRPALVKWLRGKIISRGAAVYAYIISILPNIAQLIIHHAASAWDSFGAALRGVLLIFVPAFLLNSAYIIPAIVFVACAALLYWLARRDEQRESEALQRQKTQREVAARTAFQTEQQNAIKRAIEQQLERRWYGGSSVVSSLPEQSVEAQPDDLTLLPPALQPLPGRADDTQWLIDRLHPKPGRLIALYGPAGVGKTSVVAAALAQVRDRFSDGVAVIDCSSSHDARILLALALARFAPISVASAEDAALAAVALHAVKGNHILIVLENLSARLDHLERLIAPLRDAELAVLAVAREPLDADLFPVGTFRQIGPLPPERASEMLAAIAGDHSNSQSAAAVAPLLGGNPLALTLVGRYAHASGRPLDVVAHDLGAPSPAAPGSPATLSPERVVAALFERLPRPAQRLYVALAAHSTMALSEAQAVAFARSMLPTGKDASIALAALVNGGFFMLSQQGAPLNLYAQRLVAEDAQGRFARQGARTQRRTMERLERLYMAKAAYTANAVQSPDQAAYLRMIRRDFAMGAARRVIALCFAAAGSWRDDGQTGALLVYLPIGLRAVDRGRASPWPWRWLWYRLPHMRRAYYHMLYYYADALREIEQAQLARVVFLRSLHIARFRRDTVGRAEVFGGLASTAQQEANWLEDKDAREADRKQASAYYQRVLDILEPIYRSRAAFQRFREHKRGNIVKDIANAYAGLGRNALALDNLQEAERLERKGIDTLDDAARKGMGGFDDAYALLYGDLGDLAVQQGQLDLAAQRYQQALDHISPTGSPDWWTEVTSRLVDVDFQLGGATAAERRLEQSVERGRAIGGPLGEGLSRLNLGVFLINRGEFEQAEPQLRRAAQLLKLTRNRWAEATATLNLGVALQAQGDTDGAESAYRQSLVAFREAENKWGTSIAFMKLGEIASQRGEIADGEDLFTEARRIAVAAHDRATEADILVDLGRAALDRARFDLARSYYREAHDIYQGSENALGAANALCGLSSVAERLSDFEPALAHLSQAEALYQKEQAASNLADATRARGDIAYLRGESEHAERLLSAALESLRRQRNVVGEGASLVSLAMLALDRGAPDSAREQCAQASAIFQRSDYRYAESVSLVYQGRAALALGQLDGQYGAEHALDAAHERFSRMGSLTMKGYAQVWRGRLAFMRGRFDEAARLLRSGATLAESMSDPRGQGLALIFQAELGADTGATTASADASAALELARRSAWPQGEGLAHATLAALTWRAGELDAASSHIEQALHLLSASEMRVSHALALSRRAQIRAALGDAETALSDFRSALQAARAVTDAYTLALITQAFGAFLARQSPASPEARDLLQESADIARQCGFTLAEPSTASVGAVPARRG